MNVNFEYYKIFYIIAKNKNITKAANELNISQPAISRVLKTMEDQMNIKLFIRKNKGVILTPEGNELYRLIEKNIRDILKAENDFSKIINDKNLKIAINKNYLDHLIKNNKINNILDNHKNVTFINTNDFDLLNNQITNNLIDYAYIFNINNYQFNNEINIKRLEELHLIFVSNSKDNLNKSIVILNNPEFKEKCNRYITEHNIVQENLILVDDYDNVYSLIINGFANGFLFKEFINDELKSEKLYELSSSSIYNMNTYILYNKNKKDNILNYFDEKKDN